MKRRNPVNVFLLSLVTFGVYFLVWYYKINRELRDHHNIDVSPGLALLAITLGSVVVVPFFVSIAKTGGRIALAQQKSTGHDDCSGLIGCLLLFVLWFTPWYYQKQLNRV